jgi:DNA-3-methyladenine glycosylase
MQPIDRSFFQRDPVTCARELIGCELVWKGCAGIVVETEAYAAINDEACHTFARPSARAFVAKHPPGTAYVYFNYGMYWLLNVLVKGGREDGFVLFRALQPTRGLAAMERRRSVASRDPQSAVRLPQSLCSGPGKLAMALGVDGRDHGRDLCRAQTIGFRTAPQPVEIVADLRIGISKAAHLPWRFLASGSEFVSAPPWERRRPRAAVRQRA